MLSKTPPMGWNSWNTFGANISDALIRETADQLVITGLAASGYEYVVIDDIWALRDRDQSGRMVADPEKFPHGMKALADYVHSKGLKFGMYSCAGIMTCASYPGSFDYEFIDAQTFAEWGVDFLKYDYCFKPASSFGPNLYKRMAMALRASGREILFSACNWGAEESEKWMRTSGAHMWRSTGDIEDNWTSIIDILQLQNDKEAYGAPGCFNDMDMLVVGMYGKGNVGIGGCSDVEYKSHFSLWALLNSPLMIGADVRCLSEAALKILSNKDIIALNQDEEGRQPYQVTEWTNPKFKKIYVRALKNGEYAVGMFNLGDHSLDINLMFCEIGLTTHAGYHLEFTELWEQKLYGRFKDKLTVSIDSHDCKVFKVKLVKDIG